MKFLHRYYFVFIWLTVLSLCVFLFLNFKSDNNSKFRYTNVLELSSNNAAIIASNNNEAGMKLLDNSKEILKRAPLNEEALIYAAFGNFQLDSMKFNNELFNAAIKRNPRNKLARRALLWDARRNNDIPSIINELSVLHGLDPKNGKLYIAELVNLSKTEVGISLIDEYLAYNSTWSYDFLIKKIRTLSVNEISSVNHSVDIFLKNSNINFNQKNKIIEQHASRLIQILAPQDSLLFWLKSTDLKNYPSPEAFNLFNANFLQLSATPPFNWTIFNNKAVSTEYNKVGGLFGSFRGQKPAIIARQYIPWGEEENSSIRIEGIHKFNKNKGIFSLEIRCLETNKLIGEAKILHSLEEGGAQNIDLNLHPNNCTFAYLDIKATPGQFASPISITILHLNFSS